MPNFDNVFLVFLNGPPGCGKDSGAEAVQQILNRRPNVSAVQMKMAEGLKRSVLVDAGLPYGTPLHTLEAEKDIPKAIWGGVSFRQRCIIKSENYMKPQFGKQVYGRLFVQSLRAWAEAITDLELPFEKNVVLVTDTGFFDETLPVLEEVPERNVALARIHAEERGKTFENDSRSYITLSGSIPTLDIENNAHGDGGFADYVDELSKWIIGVFDL